MRKDNNKIGCTQILLRKKDEARKVFLCLGIVSGKWEWNRESKSSRSWALVPEMQGDDYARLRGASLSSPGAASLDEAVDVWRSASKRESRRSICCCDFSVIRRCAAISSMALLRADERSVEDEAET